MSKIRFGVIGCGYISKKSFIPALIESKSAELIGVSSKSIEKAHSYADEFNCIAFSNYNELLLRKDIDAVYIATTPSEHDSIICAAAKNKKHILCEKPLSTSLDSVNKLVDICKKNKLGLLEGFMYQFHPQHKYVKEYIKNDDIGTPIMFEAKFGFPFLDKNNYRYSNKWGGGALLDAGVYTIHSARKFFMREPIVTHAIINSKNNKVDTQGSILLDFKYNQTAQLCYGFNNYYQNNYSVWCTKGRITVNRAFSIPPDFQPEVIVEINNKTKSYKIDPSNQFIQQIDNFVNGLQNKQIRNEWYTDACAQANVVQSIFNIFKKSNNTNYI